MRTRDIVGVCLAVGLVACGFSGVGVGGPGGDATTNGDGGSSSSSDASGTSGDGGGLPGDVMALVECDSGLVDSRLVILPANGSTCPSGTIEKTVQTAPQANAGACSCGACKPTDSMCAGPNFTWLWGSSNSCSPGMKAYTVPMDNACVVVQPSGGIDVYNRWYRVPTAGSCTAAAVTDVTKVATTALRQCVPDANAGVCAAVAAGQRTCVPSDLDGGACTGMFSVPVVVGDAASVTCAECGCARTATACNVEYHNTPDCSDAKIIERLADNTCVMTGQPTMQAIKVYPKNVTCTPTPGLPTATLTNSRALCCTP